MSDELISKSIQELHNLTEWAVSVQFEDLPKDVVAKAKCVFLDDLGAIICGSQEYEPSYLRQLYGVNDDNKNEATVLAAGFPTTDIFTAAELNGTAGCWVELDGGYRLAVSHAGIYSLPALLALAEKENATFDRLLTALVVGYEFGARFAESWELPNLLIHPHGVFSMIAATAACAKLKCTEKDAFFRMITTASALTINSPFDHAIRGALVRNTWTGMGARLGLYSVFVNEAGMYGLDDSPYSVFSKIYRGVFKPSVLDKDLGKRYAIMSGYHKMHACCAYMHTTLEAILELRKQYYEAGMTSEPEEILVEIHDKGTGLTQVHPKTTLGSKFSVPHAAAAAWTLGESGYYAFNGESLNNPSIRELREKVIVEPICREGNADPADRSSRVTIRFADGSSSQSFAMNSMGDPTRPLTEQQLVQKFCSMTSDILTKPEQFAEYILHYVSEQSMIEVLNVLKELQ